MLNQWDKGFSPCWPSSLNLAATWDTNLTARWATEIAQEFGVPNRGQLGPGVDIARYPYNGRLGEYLSGEDPYFGAKIAGAQVRAVRSVDMPPVQVLKHFIANTIENDRTGITEVFDERTLFEVYYPPFEAAVNEGVSAVMCSYNLVHCTTGMCNAGRTYACASDDTLNKHLKGVMGFKGLVMSDWDATKCQAEAAGSGGCHASYVDADFAAEAGLDMEMPACMTFAGGAPKRTQEKEARLHFAYMVQGRDISGLSMDAAQKADSFESHLLDGPFCCWWPQGPSIDCNQCASKDSAASQSDCTAIWHLVQWTKPDTSAADANPADANPASASESSSSNTAHPYPSFLPAGAGQQLQVPLQVGSRCALDC